MKASLANWWLCLDNKSSNIGLIRALPNCSDLNTKMIMRKPIPRKDHVKNKGRQDPSKALTLCNPQLTLFRGSFGCFTYTAIPELDKYRTES